MSGQNGQRGLPELTAAPDQAGARTGGAVAALAALLAVVLLTAVGVAALRTGTASADTVLRAGSDAVVQLANGSSRPAVPGQTVPRDATVRAGRTGAELVTRDRVTYLGQATSVTILDGARQALRAGYVMVDASRGPGVVLSTTAAVVATAKGSLVRVVAGPLVRVGVLRGSPAVVRAAGRQASSSVPRYYQAQVAPGGLPTEASPLLLTGDRFERDLARELYNADRDLNALARRLDLAGAAGPAVLAVLQATVPQASVAQASVPQASPTAAAETGAPDSERALGFLLAAAIEPTRPDRTAASYTRVRDLRTAGGSWGVVAAIVGVTTGQVSGALGALLAAPTAPVVLAEAPGPALLPGLLPVGVGGGTGAAPDPAPGLPAGDGSGERPDGGTGPGPGPVAGPSPLPSPGPVPGLPVPAPAPSPLPSTGVPVVDAVVDTVLEVLQPSPSASPSASPTPPAPLLGVELTVPSVPALPPLP